MWGTIFFLGLWEPLLMKSPHFLLSPDLASKCFSAQRCRQLPPARVCRCQGAGGWGTNDLPSVIQFIFFDLVRHMGPKAAERPPTCGWGKRKYRVSVPILGWMAWAMVVSRYSGVGSPQVKIPSLQVWLHRFSLSAASRILPKFPTWGVLFIFPM